MHLELLAGKIRVRRVGIEVILNRQHIVQRILGLKLGLKMPNGMRVERAIVIRTQLNG